MINFNIMDLFQGISTMMQSPSNIVFGRIGLILLGMLLIYLGKKEILEPLLMIPMGLGMIAINAGVLFLDPVTASAVFEKSMAVGQKAQGTIFLAPLVQDPHNLMYILQVDFLQPIYTFTFSNGLIACLVFMGIGILLDVSYLLARPFISMFLALCAEFGTIMVFPIAIALGLHPNAAASIAMVGGADGPMVLYTSLILAKNLFVPITVVAYLYLGLTYGGYPYLIKLMIPAKLRAIKMANTGMVHISSGEKTAFVVIACAILCLLFPVAAPLFLSLFVGVAIRESGLKHFIDLIGGPILYGATFFLGLLLGVLCEASTILSPVILPLLLLGILALILSGMGGIWGGYLMFFFTKGKFNPTIGIAAVSCVPTTAKVAQKSVSEVNPDSLIMPWALGANVSGVITSAIIAAIYVILVPLMK